MIVLPLAGSCSVDTDAGAADLAGPPDVFSAVTDCAYVPRDTAYEINAGNGGRFALACARSQAERLPFRHVRAETRSGSSCAAPGPARGGSATSALRTSWRPTG